MHARPLFVAFALLALAPVVRAGEPTPPPPLRVTVRTEVLPPPAPGATPAKPAEPRPVAAPLVVELDQETCAAPEGFTSPMCGTLVRAGRKTPVVVAYDAEGKLALLLDANGDGKLDPASECSRCAPQTSKQGKVDVGTEGKFEGVRLDATKVRATASLRTASLVANVILSTENRGVGPSASTVLALSEQKPEAVTTPPSLPGKLLYGSATLLGKTFHFAFARGDGPAFAGIVSDKPDLSSPVTLPLAASPVRRGMRVIGMRWANQQPVTVAGERVTLNVVESQPNAHVALVGEGARLGTADVDGAKWQLMLLDADLDGGYDGAADRWWFGPAGSLERPNPNNMAEGDAPMLLERAVTWRVTAVGADGTAVLDRAVEPTAVETTLRRRSERVNAEKWFPIFAADKAFGELRKLDTKRALAKEPAPFHFALTLDEAKAVAAAEGKPLLVDFEADWCVWCKRLDFHTYPDAEVVGRLAKFTAVKLNVELDPKQSFRTGSLHGGGIPAVALFGDDGEPVHFRFQREGQKEPVVVDRIAGWLRPEEFVAALDAALAAYADVKAGKPRLELPAPPTKPTPPRAPTPPVAPKPPEVPTPPQAPKAPEAPPAPTAPETPKAPDAPKAPEPPPADTPKAPDAPPAPETPKAP